MAETRSADPQRKFALLALIFSVIGACIAAYLLKEHYSGGAMLGCSKSGAFDCETVNRSCYSEVKGIPLALWGLFGYVICAILSGRRMRVSAQEGDGAMAFAFVFGLFALGGDMFLFWAQATQLHAYCLWCIFSYVASLGLVVSSLLTVGAARVIPSIRRDWDELGSSKTLGYVLIVIIGIAFGFVLMRKPPEGAHTCGPFALFNEATNGIALPSGWTGEDAKIRDEIVKAPFLDPGPGSGYSRGPAEAKMVIIEFGDLECPACLHFSHTMEDFVTRHPNDVLWVFRHYPLDLTCNPNVRRKIHEFACSTSRSAEGAGMQGKFWEFEHAVYDDVDETGKYKKPDLSDAQLEVRAKKLGLDIEKWKKDSASDAVISKIGDDVQMGAQVGIESTPTFFVNGRLISGGRDIHTLEIWLDMIKKGELPAKPAKAPAPTN